MATTIITKYGSGAPAASDVVRGELAVDTENGRLYTETSGGSVIEIGLNPSGNVDVTGTVTADGLTVDGDVTVTGASAISLSSTQHITYQTTSTNATAGDHIFKSYNTEIMRIDGNNNRVGIGTASPDYNFHVSGSGDTIAAVTAGASSVAGLNLGNSTNKADGGIRYDNSADALIFRASNAEKMRIDSNGQVGIGTTSPSTALTVSGAFNASSAGSKPSITGTGNYGGGIGFIDTNVSGMYTDTSGANLKFFTNQSSSDAAQDKVAMTIDGSGNVGINTTDIGANLSVRGDASAGVINVLDVGNNQNAATTGDGARIRIHCTVDENRGVAIGNLSETNYATDNSMVFYTSASSTLSEKMRITSAGRVGIGTDSPSELLHVSEGSSGAGRSSDADTLFLENNGNAGITIGSSTTGTGSVRFADSGGTGRGVLFYDHSSDFMSFHSAGGERMRIDSSGSVGIGTTSPAKIFHVNSGTANIGIRVESSDATSSIEFMDSGTTSTGTSARVGGISNDFFVQTNAAERMRIDSSGNLLLGTTDSNVSNNGASGDTGFNLLASGQQKIATDDDLSLILNRLNGDGGILEFKKNGSAVGSIACNSDTTNAYMIIGKGAVGLQFARDADADNIMPARPDNQSLRDNAIDLGSSSFRFDDIYATNGTIQTSDRNEKQDIEALSDAEQRVAVAAKGLLRKFRWKSSVEENGDGARIHFGIIAQDLQAAFEAEGLDAGRYAMFINTTWTDEETGEERSRMGVRYSELLAFIIAAI